MNMWFNTRTIITVIVLALVLISAVITVWNEIAYRLSPLPPEVADDYSHEYEQTPYSEQTCNVAGVTFHGTLTTYYVDPTLDPAFADAVAADSLMYYLAEAEASPHIQVILLEVDSYGGLPVAAEELANYIKKNVSKPVITQIRGAGASAAYWVASASDVIFASALSDIGSIGVTISYTDNGIANEQSGYTYNELSSGKFKDMGSPDKTLSAEERALYMRDIQITYDAFVKTVSNNRRLRLEKVYEIADGSSVMGETALQLGLIDHIGNSTDVEKYIHDTYSIEPVICW